MIEAIKGLEEYGGVTCFQTIKDADPPSLPQHVISAAEALGAVWPRGLDMPIRDPREAAFTIEQ